MSEPIAKVFRLAYEEQGYGIPIHEALNHMTRSVNSMDLRFFITAVNVQRETGGNLSEILEKLGMTIRERFKYSGSSGYIPLRAGFQDIYSPTLPSSCWR